MRNTDVDYGMRFVLISDKDEVLRISHAGMSELFDRKLALPQYAGKRIRWCEVVVSLKEGRAVAVQRFLSRYIHFDAHGVLDLDRQLEEARLRMDVSSSDITRKTCRQRSLPIRCETIVVLLTRLKSTLSLVTAPTFLSVANATPAA